MNIKLIACSAVLTGLMGTVAGLGVAEAVALEPPHLVHRDRLSPYLYLGAGIGLLWGGAQEAWHQRRNRS